MPIHIAITRQLRPGCEAEFQPALRELFQAFDTALAAEAECCYYMRCRINLQPLSSNELFYE